jgi:hypothetical protein
MTKDRSCGNPSSDALRAMSYEDPDALLADMCGTSCIGNGAAKGVTPSRTEHIYAG